MTLTKEEMDYMRHGAEDCHWACDSGDLLKCLDEIERLRAAIEKHKRNNISRYFNERFGDHELWEAIK